MRLRPCPDCQTPFEIVRGPRQRCIECGMRRARWQSRIIGRVNRAIRSGKLKRVPCEVCGSTRHVDAHHDDYSKPLDVRWLCRSHHWKHHAQQRKATA